MRKSQKTEYSATIEKQESNAAATASVSRCWWCGDDPLYIQYHDEEWGRPVHDDRKLFEMLILEGAQAGLSWITILRRREGYRTVFDNFDPVVNAAYTDEELSEKLKDERIIRNRLKVFSVRTNAVAFLKIVESFGSFDAFIWQFTGGKTIVNSLKSPEDVIVTSPESDAMSKALKKHGFKFIGSTICYAYMQAVGMVNDHLTDCHCYQTINHLI
ncbi:DNA-3-methyladenine glycosylase I [Fusibacter paucivorans]|uniref:DNA-3-methyladenine glycosylase I n=1 Tax=Fusibacter paucivorans TaxID=76009 RepID=A0ABS5PT45_9FIRM|nr:DNA-3-methyladenine glycosylase I [Fusibacter paucivorans]MBS7528258.1 DNA-3-methyladenine glycosylase I [Fusibacter paucivorans]